MCIPPRIRGRAIWSSARLSSYFSITLLAGIRTALCYHAPMQPITPQDYTGTGAAVTLASILGVTKCKWFQVTGDAVAGFPARVGDSHVSLDVASPVTAGRGFPIPGGGGQFSPPIALAMEFYDLTAWWIVVANLDIVSVACAI